MDTFRLAGRLNTQFPYTELHCIKTLNSLHYDAMYEEL